MIKKIFFF